MKTKMSESGGVCSRASWQEEKKLVVKNGSLQLKINKCFKNGGSRGMGRAKEGRIEGSMALKSGMKRVRLGSEDGMEGRVPGKL